MTRFIALALVAVVALSPTHALAAELGPELDRVYLRLAQGPRALSRLADCLINRHPEEARAVFDHDPDSFAHRQAAERPYANGSMCLFSTRRIEFPGLMAMGAMAEHLIREDNVARPLNPVQRSSFAGGGIFRWEWRGQESRVTQSYVSLGGCLLDATCLR